ncbi:MAG: efflux RND transporter periplasmic adaptor subunit [Gemmataceae bacterium]|nr:efflux RND transporter periplasmic adaptor subunit [Gemmataceae bacterium]
MARPKWLIWLVAVTVMAALGGGLWYASRHGWLTSAYHRVHQLVSKEGAGKPDHGGMGMDMPGMDMGGQPSDVASDVPGYAKVTIPGEIQQRIGVTVGRVEKAPLRMSVRTVGIIRPDETKVARVHLRTEGWVERLFVNYTGQEVKKGAPLLAIYSPQFLTTQQEYLNARQGGQQSLAELARQRLELWDVPREAIEELGRTGKPRRNLILESPLTGTVLEKNVLEKEYVTPQKELYVLADLSTVWVQAKVYEYELSHVELGQPATVTLPALPERAFTGKVVFVQPTVEERTRTVQVRVELPNREGLLKPGMFAHINIAHTMGEGLLIPTAAVIRTGERDLVFRVEPANSKGMDPAQMDHAGMRGMERQADRFVPVVVKIDTVKFGDRFHILEGLKAGDRVVTSANFLVDSESRLRMGAGGMAGMPGMDMGGMPGMDHSQMKDMDQKKENQKGMGQPKDSKGADHSKMKH